MMTFDIASVSERLKPAADLDAHLALVRRDDEEDAVVLLLGADAPMAAELIAEILDGKALEGGQRHDDDLVRALVLERFEARVEFGNISSAQEIGVVDHPAGELRIGWLGRGGGPDESQRARGRTEAERQSVGPCLPSFALLSARTSPPAPWWSPRRR